MADTMTYERKLSVLYVWNGADAEGRAVRDVTAKTLTQEQEAALLAVLGPELFTVWTGPGNPDMAETRACIEIRACVPLKEGP